MTTSTDPRREPGYRGSLPPRDDRLAQIWLLIVAGIFVLIIVLSAAGIPSRFLPDPTPIPTPVPASAEPSASADASAEASESAEASASPEGSVEASASPSE